MFHVPFDVLGAVIYGTELVMWIGIMICGVVLGRGEKEPREEVIELPQVIEPTRSESRTSVRSQRSGELLSGSDDQDLFFQTRAYVPDNRDIQYSIPLHYDPSWRHDCSKDEMKSVHCPSKYVEKRCIRYNSTDKSNVPSAGIEQYNLFPISSFLIPP